jgi:hypothetical protein
VRRQEGSREADRPGAVSYTVTNHETNMKKAHCVGRKEEGKEKTETR